MSTNKQQREAAHRKLQRQLERRAEQERKRRQNWLITAAVASVAVVALAVWLIVANTGEDDNPPAAGSSDTASVPPAAPTGCTYPLSPEGSGEVKDVGVPEDTQEPVTTGTVDLNVKTTAGDMTFSLDRALAPCSVASWEYLVSKKFYDNSPCHRLTTDGIFVLQCGDPSGSGSGGPSYRYLEEPPADASAYTEGVIAMANTGQPSSTGSQFFIIWKDSTQGLGPQYTVVGKVTKGLDLVQKIAAAGTVDGGTDGKPKTAITINSIAQAK